MRTATILTFALLLGACGGRDAQNVRSANTTSAVESQPISTNETLTPEQLGELGAKIRKEPARAHEILTARGLTEETFEKAIRDVTENPDASKRYANAYRKASS